MNILFVTQGEFAPFYLDMLSLIAHRLTLDRIGFYVTDKASYQKYLKKAENLELEISFLKGWEISLIKDEKLDSGFLEKIQEEFGEPFLWDTLIMDRRVYNGILTKYKQDYKPRFTHTEMLLLLQKGFKTIMEFTGDVQPDIIIGGFTPVTFGEYIFYLWAKAKKVKYINLNPTKILNYVTFSEEVHREFPHIKEDYQKYLTANYGEDVFWEKAKKYIKSKDKKYEGVVISSARFPYQNWCINVLRWPFVAAKYYLKKGYLDNQQKGRHWGSFYKNIYNPIKDKIVQKFLPYHNTENLNHVEYAYYPLHVEPEIALSLFGKEYLNQIELTRNIAKAIPVTWKLAVKDHPAGVGRRNIRYYKKLLEIPNVILISHYIDSTYVIEKAKIVFTVSGFSGFEAILKNKPVITFGKTFYDTLPNHIVRNVRSLERLPFEVKELTGEYRPSENHIICLVAAIIKNSVPLNLYSEVLRKGGRLTVENSTFDQQKMDFANYMLKWINLD
jgi:hypothetical protein